MDILAAIKREERKLEKQLGKLQHQLSRVHAAARAKGRGERRSRFNRIDREDRDVAVSARPSGLCAARFSPRCVP